MKKRWGKTNRFAFVVSCLISSSAFAFIPASDIVFSKWAEKTKPAKTLVVKQKTTFFETRTGDASTTIEEEIRCKRPGLFRRTSVFPRGKVESIVGPQRAVRVTLGKSELFSPPELLGAPGILFSLVDSRNLQSLFRQVGVDLDSFRWALVDGVTGWEAGAPAGNRLQLSKDAWLPLGAVFGSRRYVFQASSTGKFPIPFPEAIEVYEGSKMVERTVVENVQINVPVSDDWFDARRVTEPQVRKSR